MAEHLTERQKKWFASVQASLERDTGKTLAEWVAIARTCPETTPRKRTEWLREHHGLGVNRIAHILSEAFPSEISWDDGPALRAALWKDSASTAIFEAIERKVKDYPGLVSGQRKGFSAWSKEFQFASVRPLKGGKARLGLAVLPEADPRLEPYRNEGWSERLKSALTLSSPDEVDDSIADLLKQAWDRSLMANPNPPGAVEKLGPALQLHATYVGNLNNLLGFYLVIAGFLFAGYFQLSTASTPKLWLAALIALLGMIVSIVFRLLDGRARTIIDHVEAVIGGLEEDVFGQDPKPHADIPRSPVRLGVIWGHVTLIRSIYWFLGGGFLVALLSAVFEALC